MSEMKEVLGASKPGLYRRSLLFEFRHPAGNGPVIDSLILPVPPESIKITQPMRKNMTQTMGGVVINHFGLGLGQITISGITGVSGERRFTLGEKEYKRLGPYSAAKASREILERIGRYPVRKDFADKFAQIETRIYDLTSLGEMFKEDMSQDDEEIRSSLKKSDDEPLGYIVSIDNMSIDRNANRYGQYPFTISASILQYIGEYRKETWRRVLIPGFSDSSIAFLDSNIGFLEKAGAKMRQAARAIGGVRNTIQAGIRGLSYPMRNFLSGIKSLEESILAFPQFIDQAIAEWNNVVNQTADIAGAPARIIQNLYEESKRIYDFVAGIPTQLGALVDRSTGEYQTVYDKIESDINSNVSFWGDINSAATGLNASARSATKNKDIPEMNIEGADTYGTPNLSSRGGTASGASAVTNAKATAFGYKIISRTPDTTLDKLALEAFGDYRLGGLILSFNGFDEWDEVPVGAKIKIPITNPTTDIQGNEVYSAESLAILGIDLAIDGSGNLLLDSHGNPSFRQNTDNLLQAVRNRLNAQLGANLRRVSYGTPIKAGEALNTLERQSYVTAAILDTIAQEQRVEKVEELEFTIDENTITISLLIKPIIGEPVHVYKVIDA